MVVMYMNAHILSSYGGACSTSGVQVSDRPGSWAVAGDHVILALQGTEMNKLRYVHVHVYTCVIEVSLCNRCVIQVTAIFCVYTFSE